MSEVKCGAGKGEGTDFLGSPGERPRHIIEKDDYGNDN